MRAGFLAIALAALIAGCSSSAGGESSPGVDTAYGGGAPSGSSGGGVQLVDVDTDQTLTVPQQAGKGVGVFTQYESGGHWTVSWTCDTTLTNLSCNFQIGVTVASGAITNPASNFTGQADQLAQPSAGAVSATTVTTTTADAITFDTAPGAVITLDAKLDGNESGAFLFFVQDGQVNGGYQGTLDDPLMLEPSSP